jgi:hypothetical protein
MTWPTLLHEVPPPEAVGDRPPRWWRRAWRRAGQGARGVGAWLTRPARLLPGLGAVGCAVAGSWLLWGLGVALLVAAGFCLLLDARTPRG